MINKELLNESILVFTDGACKGNPGPGGWGAIIATPDGKVKEMGKHYESTTNNQMELQAIIVALLALQETPGNVAIFTDSTYAIRGITQWIFGWKRNGWKTSAGHEVSNQTHWQNLERLVRARKGQGEISWHYVRGHRGIPGNERVDEIASELALKNSVSFYDGSLLQYEYAIHDIPEDTSLPDGSLSSKTTKKKAYSYLSYVDGKLMTHKTWPECEARVKGRRGAKFKKATSSMDELEIKKSWGLIPE